MAQGDAEARAAAARVAAAEAAAVEKASRDAQAAKEEADRKFRERRNLGQSRAKCAQTLANLQQSHAKRVNEITEAGVNYNRLKKAEQEAASRLAGLKQRLEDMVFQVAQATGCSPLRAMH